MCQLEHDAEEFQLARAVSVSSADCSSGVALEERAAEFSTGCSDGDADVQEPKHVEQHLVPTGKNKKRRGKRVNN